MNLYGKDETVKLVASMIKRNRLHHSFILVGESGVGKKTLAMHLAKMILCSSDEPPCGKCKSCIMCDSGGHPDICVLSPSGKSLNYRTDDLRFLVTDSTTAANEGGYKVYVIPEIDRALPVAQNALLKIIEEPPADVVFIMTATSKEKLLPTVLSRAIVLSVVQMTNSECVKALTDSGYTLEQAENAVEYFGGNIGSCLRYLSGEENAVEYNTVTHILSAIANADEYMLLKELSNFDGDRQSAISGIELLEEAIRDAVAAKNQLSLSGPLKESAKLLAKHTRTSGLERMYRDCKEAVIKINGNANLTLTLADLACKLRSHSLG